MSVYVWMCMCVWVYVCMCVYVCVYKHTASWPLAFISSNSKIYYTDDSSH